MRVFTPMPSPGSGVQKAATRFPAAIAVSTMSVKKTSPVGLGFSCPITLRSHPRSIAYAPRFDSGSSRSSAVARRTSTMRRTSPASSRTIRPYALSVPTLAVRIATTAPRSARTARSRSSVAELRVGVSPYSTWTSPSAASAASSATRTASPVPRICGWMATVVPGGRIADAAASVSGDRTTTGRAPAAMAASRDHRSRGLPAQACRIFGILERMRLL